MLQSNALLSAQNFKLCALRPYLHSVSLLRKFIAMVLLVGSEEHTTLRKGLEIES